MKDLKKYATEIVEHVQDQNYRYVIYRFTHDLIEDNKDELIEKVIKRLNLIPNHIENLLAGNLSKVLRTKVFTLNYEHTLCECLKTNFRNEKCKSKNGCNIIDIENYTIIEEIGIVTKNPFLYDYHAKFRNYCKEIVLELKRKEFMKPYGVAWELMSVVWNPRNLDKFKYIDPDVFG